MLKQSSLHAIYSDLSEIKISKFILVFFFFPEYKLQPFLRLQETILAVFLWFDEKNCGRAKDDNKRCKIAS